ncbi:hypothetical protein AB0M79_09235 [Polymorphospora sp. NPDC051019]|uniref:hypothetical protein n=1 Tax=Polymorphospora sp. NPDC051019 TaxID=3155725 RepID=UPI00341FE5CD
MRSTDRPRIGVLVTAVLIAASLTACGTPERADSQLPRFDIEGTRAHMYTSVQELADKASAIIVATPTGKSHSRPLPPEHGEPDSAPTRYVKMTVTKVVQGTLDAREIDLVSPGVDQSTGDLGLLSGGPFLLFVTPAMYGPNDPAGGYVVVGGPAGVYAKATGATAFQKVDVASGSLPATLRDTPQDLPAITKTEAQLLREGP